MFDFELDFDLAEMVNDVVNKKVEQRVAAVLKENTDLQNKITELTTKLKDARQERDKHKKNYKNNVFLLEMINTFKTKLDSVDKTEKSNLIQKFLEQFYEPDFYEDTHDCPIWLGAVTNFYSHKSDVIRLLELLEVDMPENISTFRLPHEWSEYELDMVFATMGRHIVCNCCTFADNLRFWSVNALSSVYNICSNCGYSEILWQFLLRNPNLLKDKYLIKMGKMAFEESYVSGWRYLFNINKYQELTPEQIELIINNINPYAVISNRNRNSVIEFLLANIEYVKHKALLDSLYEEFKDSYDFKYNKIIFKLPAEYLENYLTTVLTPQGAVEWIMRNKNTMSKEQRHACFTYINNKYLKEGD